MSKVFICPTCKAEHDRSTLLGAGGGVAMPRNGDVSVCIACASVNVFDENLDLRRPTEAELEFIKREKDSFVARAQAAIRETFH